MSVSTDKTNCFTEPQHEHQEQKLASLLQHTQGLSVTYAIKSSEKAAEQIHSIYLRGH